MDYKEVPIIREERIDSLIRSDFYKKDGKVVKVLYYNNGLVSESSNDEVINRRIISEEEKQNIIRNHNRLIELRKVFNEIDDEMGEISKRARHIVSAQEKLRY